MKIIVCVKQVPDTNNVKIDPVKGTLIREGVPSILNPDDANALEEALRLKEKTAGTKVLVITMGPPQAAVMLRECLAMGADEAYLLIDRAFGGADTCATSAVLAAGIRKIGDFDLILAGRQAIDGDTAQVGPQAAMRLGVPLITYVKELHVVEKELHAAEKEPHVTEKELHIEKGKLHTQEKEVIAKRQVEDGYERIRTSMPCLVTCVKELNTPRYMTISGIMDAYEKEITVWGHRDIGMKPEECGLNASPTRVVRSFTPPFRGKGEKISEVPKEAAKLLVGKLRERHIV